MQCELGQAVLVVGHLVPAARFNERSQPVEPGVGPQHVIINLRIFCLVGFEILKQCLTPGNGLEHTQLPISFSLHIGSELLAR